MADNDTLQWKLINALFELATNTPWRGIGMGKIAEYAGVPLGEALAICPDKTALFDAAIAEVTKKSLAECASFTEEDSVRDRLFALLMARFDAMSPYRNGAAAVARGIAGDPVALICRLPHAMAAMAQTLEAAGVDSSGLRGMIYTKGLAFVFANTVREWLRDSTEDLGPTMAALDRNLGRADMFARQFCRGTGTPETAETPSPEQTASTL